MFYSVCRFIIAIIYHSVFWIRVEGAENMPESGSAIICANHISAWDPLSLIMSTRRQIHFMAKKELFANPVLDYVITHAGSYPVDRAGADMSAYRTTMDYLKKEQAIGIFAQGTRIKDGDEKAAKGGVALFASKSGSLIVPIGIIGSYRPFSRVTVRIGKPLEVKVSERKKVTSEEIAAITEKLMNEINALV